MTATPNNAPITIPAMAPSERPCLSTDGRSELWPGAMPTDVEVMVCVTGVPETVETFVITVDLVVDTFDELEEDGVCAEKC